MNEDLPGSVYLVAWEYAAPRVYWQPKSKHRLYLSRAAALASYTFYLNSPCYTDVRFVEAMTRWEAPE